MNDAISRLWCIIVAGQTMQPSLNALHGVYMYMQYSWDWLSRGTPVLADEAMVTVNHSQAVGPGSSGGRILLLIRIETIPSQLPFTVLILMLTATGRPEDYLCL